MSDISYLFLPLHKYTEKICLVVMLPAKVTLLPVTAEDNQNVGIRIFMFSLFSFHSLKWHIWWWLRTSLRLLVQLPSFFPSLLPSFLSFFHSPAHSNFFFFKFSVLFKRYLNVPSGALQMLFQTLSTVHKQVIIPFLTASSLIGHSLHKHAGLSSLPC